MTLELRPLPALYPSAGTQGAHISPAPVTMLFPALVLHMPPLLTSPPLLNKALLLEVYPPPKQGLVSCTIPPWDLQTAAKEARDCK